MSETVGKLTMEMGDLTESCKKFPPTTYNKIHEDKNFNDADVH